MLQNKDVLLQKSHNYLFLINPIANIPINVTNGTNTLKYDYSVDAKKNILKVRITTSDGRTRQDRSIYIDEKGRVYSF